MVGAAPDALSFVTPIFQAIGERWYLMGEPPAGTATKLLTNMLWFIQIVALSEALALGSASGLRPEMLAKAIGASAGDSWAADHDLDNLLAGDDDASFTLGLCCKDLALITQLASQANHEIPLAAIAREYFDRALALYGATAGELAVSRLVELDTGMSIRASTSAHASDVG
jgi:3-hydroxyisobutyrate dehydrogenase